MKSNYALYLEEKSTRNIYEDEYGFFTYESNPGGLYIADIFVREEFRGKGIAKEYDKLACAIAEELGYQYVVGSVVPGMSNSTYSISIMLSHGYELYYNTNSVIYLRKKVGE